MLTYPKTTEWVRNTKTGTVGQVVCRYNRTTDGKAIVQVRPISQMKDAYWQASHVEVA